MGESNTDSDLTEPSEGLIHASFVVGLGNNAVKPYLFCWFIHDNLIENIRDRYGAGEYRLLIRKGRKMVFSGSICLAAPPSFKYRKD